MSPCKPLSIANGYGSVDIRIKLPKAYVHIRGQRLQPLCRKLGIKYACALVGYQGRGRNAKYGWEPQFDGVVISKRSESKLLHAIAERKARTTARPIVTEETKRKRRERKQERDADRFAAEIRNQYPGMPPAEASEIAAHACAIGSGRVGRDRTLDIDQAVVLAVQAYVRHEYTDYDSILRETGQHTSAEDRHQARSEAREQVADSIEEVLKQWSA